MAQAGYTPISLYYSTTAAAVPTSGNLANGELAINITDGKLYYKSNAGVVLLLASNATSAPVLSFQTSLGGLTPSTATTGVVTLAGTLNTTSGGTGLTSFTAGDVPYYASGSVLSKLAIGTAGQFLTSTGTAPQWSTLSGVAVTTFSAGTTGFTPSSATSGAVTLAGTLATTNGGTGLTSFTSGGVVYASSSSALATSSAFQFNGTDLGLGVTPSVNTVSGSGYRQIEVGTSVGNMVFAGGSEMLVVQNAIYNSGFKYAQNTQASYYRQNGGEHQFFTAPTGTAGNNITFTQAMTLTAAGVLLVGKTSNATYSAGGALFAVNGGTDNGVSIAQSQATGPFMTFFNSANSGYASISQTAAGTLAISASTALRFDVNSAQRVNISSAGYVGINTTTSALNQYLTINGSGGALADTSAIAFWDSNSGGSRRWAIANGASARGVDQIGILTVNVGSALSADPLTSGTEVMRFTTGGNVCVGSTAAGNAGTINVSIGDPGTTAGGLQLWASTTQTHVVQWGDGTTGSDPYRGYIEYAHNGDSMRFGTSSTEKMRIRSDGRVLVNSTTLLDYSTINYNGTLQIAQSGNAQIACAGFDSSSDYGGEIILSKSRSGTIGTNTIVQNNDKLGTIFFAGANGTGYSFAAHIRCLVDGTPGASADMPGALVFATSSDGSATPTQRVRITSAGNLGVGDFTPYNTWGNSYVAVQINSVTRSLAATGAGAGDLTLAFNAVYDSTDSRWEYASTGDKAGRYSQTGAGDAHVWYVTNTNGTADAAITFTQAMTLNSLGVLLVGTTSDANLPGSGTSNATGVAIGGNQVRACRDQYTFQIGVTTTGAGVLLQQFFQAGNSVGQITVSNNNATAYQTSSDYRLKDNPQPMTGALEKVAELKPCTWTWKNTGDEGQGFIAHELAEVCPDAVSGEKDAVDEEGKPKYQGVDTSFLVATLTAAIQEQQAIIESLKARLDAANL